MARACPADPVHDQLHGTQSCILAVSMLKQCSSNKRSIEGNAVEQGCASAGQSEPAPGVIPVVFHCCYNAESLPVTANAIIAP